MEVTLVGLQENHFLARWRLRRGQGYYRLVLEGLVIPFNKDRISQMHRDQRELVEGTGAPVVILYTTDPIYWIQPSDEEITGTGIPIIPWLVCKQDPFGEAANIPQDACIRR